MAVAEELQIIIDAKVNSAIRDLKRAQKATGGAEKSAKGLSGALLKQAAAAAGAAVSIRAIVKGIGEVIDAASRAQEVNSKFNVTFSDVGETAETVATKLQDAYGLSVRESQELLASTGDLLTGFGFTQEAALQMADSVNTLAVDLASFQNLEGGAEQASQALTKALLGERESIKTLGIAITEADINRLAEDRGITGSLDRQQKAMLTLELATQQSKNAIGDFARTQDTYANQSRQLTSTIDDLKVALGENLAPAAARAKASLNQALSGITEYIQARTKLRDLKDIDVESLSVNEQIAAAQAKITELITKRENQGRKLFANLGDRLGMQNTINDRIEEQRGLLDTLKTRQENINDAVNQEAMLHELINEKLALRGQIDLPEPEDEANLEAMERLKEAYENTTAAEIEATRASIAYFETFQRGPMATAVLDELYQKLESLTGVQETSLDNIRAEHDAYTNLYGNINELTSQTKEHLDEVKQKAVETGQALQASFQDYFSAVSGLFSGLSNLASAYYDSEIAMAEGNTEKQKKLMREKAIAEKSLALFQATINTARGIAEAIPNPFLMALAAATGAVQIATIAAQPIPALAEGGIVSKPTLAMIGEAGPEAVVPLGRGGGMGGNVVINVAGSVVTERQIARMITAGQSRLMGAY